MKAISKDRPGVGASWADIHSESAPLEPDQILIRVRRASICGSDMAIYNWNSWAPRRFKLPMVFGHEFCGEVMESGSAARGFEKGDFISVESHVYCGLCYQCRNGQRHVCQNLRIIGVDVPGGFAEYARVPARCAWKHSDPSLQEIGSLMEPLGNAVYATLVEDVVGKSILVLGCGPQGLFAITVARACGAKPVIAVETSPFRRKLALRMGADMVLDPSGLGESELIRKIREAVSKVGGDNSIGADVVLEMSGSPAAVRMGLKALKNGGRFTAFGIPSKSLEIHWAEDVVFKGIRIYGVAGRQIFQTWYTMERLLKSKAIDVKPVITHTFALRDFKKAFEVMNSKSRNCGKVVLEVE